MKADKMDHIAELYAVAEALRLLSDKLHEECGGMSCLLRLLGQNVHHCTEKLDHGAEAESL